jgi:hypothetical protein
MDEYKKYYLEKIKKEHPEKVIEINTSVPEAIKKAIIEKQEWAEEVRSRKKIDLTKQKQKIIV